MWVDSPIFTAGFYAPERLGRERWRWTDGDARLVLPRRRRGAGPIRLDLLVRDLMPRWQAPERVAPPASVPPPGVVGEGKSGRQRYRRAGAAHRAVRQRHVAAVGAHDVARDRQPEPDAAGFAVAARFHAVERLKYPLELG